MSFQQGLSGLNATSKNLEVIGNNVANANTFGFKAARAEFADMYASAMNGAGTNNIGIGVNLSAVSQQFTQGNIVTTENPMDLALNGAGFFQVTDGRSPVTYTRNGQFKVDRDGYVVNNSGGQLMGYPADGTGTIQPGNASALRMPTGGINPAATSTITLEMNLDSRAATTVPAAGAADHLHRPEHLQQRHLGDGVRRQGPGRRADLLLPEVGHRHLERLRHRQRHADLHHRRRCPGAVDDDQLPGQRRHADCAATAR
jgi:flagellar hook-basal body protein